MTWHAVAAVDDALDATRRFLFPFGVIRWVKLALLVLFMAVGVNTNVSVPPFPNVETESLDIAGVIGFAAELGVETATLVAITIAVTVISVAIAVVTVTLRLVFYDALRTNDVLLWAPFKRRLRQAAGLFGFIVAVGLLFAAPFLLAALGHERGAVSFDGLSTVVFAGAALVGILLFVGVLLVFRFTYEFVIPVMIGRDEGVVAAWRRFAMTLRSSWVDFLVYLVIHFFLAFGIRIAEGVVLLFVGGVALVLGALALLVAGGLLGGLGALTATTAGVVATVLIVTLALVAVFAVLLPVRILTRTYLITYEVATLGRIDSELAMLSPAIDPLAQSDDAPTSTDHGDGSTPADRDGPVGSDDRSERR